jgi:putative hydrolase of the HAD superfamily
MPLRGVLFDLDDTLFDHHYATSRALSALLAGEPSFAAWTMDELARRHGEVLEAMHAEVLAGRVSIESARRERFRQLLVAAGNADAGANERAGDLARRYRSSYEAAWRPVAGAAALLRALRSADLRVAIVTNNVVVEQVLKIRYCGLEPLVDALVTSEEVGVAKPDARIFHVALERLGIQPGDAVMVGDAWPTDIQGAVAAGIRPVWFNRLGRATRDLAIAEIAALEPTDQIVAALRARKGIR